MVKKHPTGGSKRCDMVAHFVFSKSLSIISGSFWAYMSLLTPLLFSFQGRCFGAGRGGNQKDLEIEHAWVFNVWALWGKLKHSAGPPDLTKFWVTLVVPKGVKVVPKGAEVKPKWSKMKTKLCQESGQRSEGQVGGRDLVLGSLSFSKLGRQDSTHTIQIAEQCPCFFGVRGKRTLRLHPRFQANAEGKASTSAHRRYLSQKPTWRKDPIHFNKCC